MSEPIYRHTFSNGLALLAEPMPWLESAAFTLLVPAGTAHDPVGRCGLSSFLCEMALRGAGQRDSRQFVTELDNLGVERSESVSDAHTRYTGATVAANLTKGLALFADVVRRPHLPEDQLEAGRLVLLQELRAVEDEPSEKVMIELKRRHYAEPWGRSSYGDQKGLEEIGIEEIRRQFRSHYRPDGTILGVAGKFQWDALRDAVGELFGDWAPGVGETPAAGPPRASHVHLPYDSNQTQIGIAYPSVPYRHPDYFQAWGAVNVLSGGMSARLFTEVRERRGLCYAVYATYHTLLEQGSVFCYAGTRAERAQETLDVVLGELDRLGRGVEPEELDRLKARIRFALVTAEESSFGRSGAIARDAYHLGRARTLDEIEQLIAGLTCQSINAYLAEHPPGDFTIVTLGPRELEARLGVP